jgi:ABC-type phosphate transport system auxiliary subunit
MSPFIVPVMALMIPIVAILFAAFKSWLRLKERQLEATNTLTAEKTAQYAAQTERLEQRVRVLERIITDRGMDLTDQIEALRDPPALRADIG